VTGEVNHDSSAQDLEVEMKLDFVVQFMAILSEKFHLLPDEDKRELLQKLETMFLESQNRGTGLIDDEAILALFQAQRRQAFVEQVRRAIGPSLKDLSQRQEDLLDASLTRLFREDRPVSDEELEGQLELITQFVSPLGQEKIQKAYWDLRLGVANDDDGSEDVRG